VLTLSPSPFDYGAVGVGTTVVQTFQLFNGAATDANTLVLSLSGAPDFAFAKGSAEASTTCGGFLAAGASCAISVAFTPRAAAQVTGALNVASGGGTLATAFTGVGTAAASLKISDDPLYVFTTLSAGSSDHTFAVTNLGNADATRLVGSVSGAAFRFSGGYPGPGGTCAGFLAKGASCSLVVTFAPSAVGVWLGAVALQFDDGASAQRSLTGTRTAGAALSIAGAPVLDFGPAPLFRGADRSVIITNTGAAAASALGGRAYGLDSNGWFSFAGGHYPGTGGTCGATLAAGASCTVALRFDAYASGASAGRLQLDYDQSSSATLELKGSIDSGVALRFELAALDFGLTLVGDGATRTLKLTNGGANQATGLGGAVSGAGFAFLGGSYPGSGGTCGVALASQASCTLALGFVLQATGSSSGLVQVTGDRGVQAQATLSGSASTLQFVSNVPVVDFGTHPINAKVDRSIFIVNQASTSLVGLHASLTGNGYAFRGGSYPGTLGSCGSSLGAHQQCSMIVEFSTPIVGVASGSLSIGDQAGAGPSQALTGTGQ
jgi:hypothetical protein